MNITISKEAFINKEITKAMLMSTRDENNRAIRKRYGFKSNRGISFQEATMSSKELYNALINGYTMCSNFDVNEFNRRKDGTFAIRHKRDSNFKNSCIICVDIDETKYSSINEYIDKLTFKPTFVYSTYSNKVEDNGIRFRMVYVMNEYLSTKYTYRYMGWLIYNKIEQDTDEVIKDKCGLQCSQYFNGVNKNTANEFYSKYYGHIYTKEEFGYSEDGFKDFAYNYFYYKTHTYQVKQARIRIIGSNLLNENEMKDISQCSTSLVMRLRYYGFEGYDNFIHYNGWRYNYFYRVEKDEWNEEEINGKTYKWQHISDDYFALPFIFTKVTNGQHRRKKLFVRTCLRRIMQPSVDADTLLYNAYVDAVRFMEIDDEMTIDSLARMVNNIVATDVVTLANNFKDYVDKLKKNNPKRGIIYKIRNYNITDFNKALKTMRWNSIGELYDCSMSVKDNLEMLRRYGLNICLATLYNFCAENGITQKVDKENWKTFYNPNLSIRQNVKVMNANGLKISYTTLQKMLKESKQKIVNYNYCVCIA